MTEDEAADTLMNLLYSYDSARLAGLRELDFKLAHYTTAANAINIIRGRSIWLRNSAVMNDFMEVDFGFNALAEALKRFGPDWASNLDCHAGLAKNTLDQLDRLTKDARNHTYLSSFAEQHPDDELGKLSMWRAYGGKVAGAAIIFNIDALKSDEMGLAVFGHPVTYGRAAFMRRFGAMVDLLAINRELVKQVPADRAQSILFNVMRDMMLTTKHEGFEEEQEWRIIHSPNLFASAYVLPQIATVGDMPQVVYVLPLRDQPNLRMPELELDRLIHRVIIGPCQHPLQVAEAIHQCLWEAGVQNPGKRIKISHIPLRQ